MFTSRSILATSQSSLLKTGIPKCSKILITIRNMATIDTQSFREPETHKTELDAMDKKGAGTGAGPELDHAATGSVPLVMEDTKDDIPKNWRKDKMLPQFLRHKYAMKEKLEGKPWQPRNRVSREVMNEMKRLSEMDREKWNAKTLAVEFKKSPEAIRRILKSRYTPKQS